MKVLLTQGYLHGTEIPVYPLGLSCLGACLTKHEVKIYDPNVESSALGGLLECIQDYKPDVIGLSLRNIDSTNKRKVVFYYDMFRDMVSAVSAVLPENCLTVIGGSGFSMFAEEIFKDLSQIHFGIYREGEMTFPLLLDNLEQPAKVPGLFYRDSETILFTGPAQQTDPGSITFARLSHLNPAAYKRHDDSIGVETKRGCNLHCIYCIYSFLNGKKLRLRPPEAVVDDVEQIIQSGCNRFTFVDSAFNYPQGHAEKICSELINRNLQIRWSAWFHEQFITESFIELCIKAGCEKFIFSPDGFSDVTLKKLGKSFNKADILACFDIMRKFDGIEMCFNFFKNPPGNTLSTFFSLLSFYIRAKTVLKKRVHFEFNSLRIEPHTRLHELALLEGIVEADDNLLFPRQYTNKKTWYIESLFDFLISIKERKK